jgi:peptidoglycan/LPS O-acetylase OafA/YrhL
VRYLPAIDGLRAIAVLAVVAYHVGLGGAGYIGVDIFFVISGYLITCLLRDEKAERDRIDFMAFYARRARRILPALIVVVVAVVAASAMLLSPNGAQQAVDTSAAASLLFVGNLFFQTHSGGYFDAASDQMPLLHLWSLGVEEQFYLVWPLLVSVLPRKRFILIGLGSFALAEFWVAMDPQAAFYQMPARAWELAAGAAVALWRFKVPRGATSLALAVVLAACVVPIPHHPGAGALPAVLGTALLLAGVQAGAEPRLLTIRPIVFVGLTSYSLYLWHWPLLAFDSATRVGPPSVPWRLALAGCAFVLAWLSYRFVEKPFRRLRRPPRNIVAVGVASSLVLSLCAFAVGSREVAVSASALEARAAAADMPSMECHEAARFPVQVPRCRGRVVIWGDSMALAWMPFAEALAERAHMMAANVSRDACPPGWDGPIATVADRRCAEFNRQAQTYIENGGIDTLILAENWSGGPTYTGDLAAVIANVAPHVRRVLVIGPSPTLPQSAPQCIELEKSDECAVPRAQFEAYATPVRRRLETLGVAVVDPGDYLCDAQRCPVTKHGKVLYWDAYHVSKSAARDFASKWLVRETQRNTQ